MLKRDAVRSFIIFINVVKLKHIYAVFLSFETCYTVTHCAGSW